MPQLLSAAVTDTNAEEVVLTFDETMSSAHVPASSAFDLQVNGSAHTVSANMAGLTDGTWVLQLGSQVLPGDVVTVAYTRPPGAESDTWLRASTGNIVLNFTAEAVTNTVTLIYTLGAGTWTVPTDITAVSVQLVGGGGGGGNESGATGGGGGGTTFSTYRAGGGGGAADGSQGPGLRSGRDGGAGGVGGGGDGVHFPGDEGDGYPGTANGGGGGGLGTFGDAGGAGGATGGGGGGGWTGGAGGTGANDGGRGFGGGGAGDTTNGSNGTSGIQQSRAGRGGNSGAHAVDELDGYGDGSDGKYSRGSWGGSGGGGGGYTRVNLTVVPGTTINYFVGGGGGGGIDQGDIAEDGEDGVIRLVLSAAPLVSSATTNAAGTRVVLTFDDTLDDTSTPAVSAFDVQVGGASRAVSLVSISGATVTLNLATAIIHAQTVTVAYTEPSTNPLQRNASAQVDTFAAYTVTNIVPNQPPMADAGADQTVDAGATVTLDGSGTSDPDGTIAAYAWSRVSGPVIAFSDATVVSPTFTAPIANSQQTLVLRLTVTDDDGGTNADTVTITVRANQAPTANAGADQSVEAGETVTLDGSGSTDPEGQTLTYAWTKTSGLDITFSDASSASPTFAAPSSFTMSTVELQLEVTDSEGLTDTDTVTIAVAAQPTGFQSIVLGTPDSVTTTSIQWTSTEVLDAEFTRVNSATVQLGTVELRNDGTIQINLSGGSSAFNDAVVSYANLITWQLQGHDDVVIHGPNHANNLTRDATDPYLFVPPDRQDMQDLFAALSAQSSLTLVLDTVQNEPPVAHAGDDQVALAGERVTLNASQTTDPNVGDTLNYTWTQTAGTTVTLSSTSAIRPNFDAPIEAVAQQLTFQLTVTDRRMASSTDTVDVVVLANQAPTADAGSDQTVQGGSTVTLDGSGSSDPEGQTLSYAWTLPEAADADITLSDATVVAPTFTAPVAAAVRTIPVRLQVSDNLSLQSTADDVEITVQANQAPTASAGDNQVVPSGVEVTLDGTGSTDPEDQSLTYAWTQTSGQTVTLSDAASDGPTFTAPQTVTDLVLGFSLQVTDNLGLTDTDTVTITVSRNRPPVADAGTDQTVAFGATVTLTGSSSTDPDGMVSTYAWTQLTGTTVTLQNATTDTATFTAPNTNTQLVLTFRLTVTDNGGLTATADVSVTVEPNQAPTADAGTDQTATPGATVTLNGSGSSDPEGQTLTYAWRQTGGTTVTLSSATVASPTFTAPRVNTDESLDFELTVTDTLSLTATDVVTVGLTSQLPPIANAGPDQSVLAGETVQLDGSGSRDPDGTIASYRWDQTAGILTTLSSSNVASPTFTAPSRDAAHELVFRLVVTDNDGATSTNTVTIDVASGIPELPPIDDQVASVGRAFSVTLSAGQYGDAPLTYSVNNRPAWLRFNPTTRVLSGRVPSSAGGQTYNLSYVVRDNDNDTDTQTFDLVISHPPPSAPTGLSATAQGSDTIVLAWTSATDELVFGVRIEESTNGSAFTVLVENTMTEDTTYTRTGLARATRRYYRLRSIGSGGVGPPSAIVNATTAPTVPSAPRNLAGVVGTSSIVFSWDAPADTGGRGIASYTILISEDLGITTRVLAQGVTTRTYTQGSLPRGHISSYIVMAVNSVGTGPGTPALDLVINPIVPAAPTNLAANPGDKRIRLSWTPPYDGGSDILRYEYRIGTGAWISTRSVASSYVVTDLMNGQAYAFRVRAVNEIGNSPQSNEESLTLTAVPQGVPESPVATGRPASVLLSWLPPGNAFIPEFGWESLEPLHEGLLTESPFETNLLSAGHYSIGIKAVDTSGNESLEAAVVQSTFGDPRLGDAFLSVFPHFLGWPGVKIHAAVGAGNVLSATDQATWNDLAPTWAGWESYVSNPYSSIRYDHTTIDLGGVLTFSLSMSAAGHGQIVLQESHSNDGETYTSHATYTQRLNLKTRYIRVRALVDTSDGSSPSLTRLSVILSGDTETEVLSDVLMSTLPGVVGDRRIQLTKNFSLITNVGITLQGIDGVFTPAIIDKDVTLGPRIKVFDADGNPADVTIDIIVRGAG